MDSEALKALALAGAAAWQTPTDNQLLNYFPAAELCSLEGARTRWSACSGTTAASRRSPRSGAGLDLPPSCWINSQQHGHARPKVVGALKEAALLERFTGLGGLGSPDSEGALTNALTPSSMMGVLTQLERRGTLTLTFVGGNIFHYSP